MGRASANAPRLIDITWGNAADPRVTLIGKGVCFDSGGLDIKPSNDMRLMKKDMGGAAHVLGIARLVMAQRLPVRLRVLVPAVENAISGNAFRPGDIIRTRKGTTVEIDNTDAEGRLVLCDALALACEGDPGLIVDFATLTGAARAALGTDLPALFCNDDALAEGLLAAGRAAADPMWRMPLHQPYRKMLDSKVADIVNSPSSPYAGAITAALFLEGFVTPGVPWAHFDLMAWNTVDQRRAGRKAVKRWACARCMLTSPTDSAVRRSSRNEFSRLHDVHRNESLQDRARTRSRFRSRVARTRELSRRRARVSRPFHLLKGPTTETHTLYASHSVWESRAAFVAWTQSEAFRKAHAQANPRKGTYLGHPELETFESVL